MRARNIKPGFFENEDLSELEPMARILYIGLWCYADRKGRFEWRPKRIKALIFPYDDCDINKLLMSLNSMTFIYKYKIGDMEYGFIPNFIEHQKPHPNEAKSVIPDPPENVQQNQCHNITLHCNTNGAPRFTNVSQCSADCLNEDCLNEDCLNEDCLNEDCLNEDIRKEDSDKKHLSEYSDDFLKFWSIYPSKTGKGAAYKSWKKLKPNIDKVVLSLEWQIKSQKWKEGFIPNPQTYINQRRWDDEPDNKLIDISASRGAARSLEIAARIRQEKMGAISEI
jgi:hypothetical protein